MLNKFVCSTHIIQWQWILQGIFKVSSTHCRCQPRYDRFIIFAKNLPSLLVMPLLLAFNNKQMSTQASFKSSLFWIILMGFAVASLSHSSVTQHGLGELAGSLSSTVQPDALIHQYSTFTWKITFSANRHTAIRHKLYPYERLCKPEWDSVSSAPRQCPKEEGALKDC